MRARAEGRAQPVPHRDRPSGAGRQVATTQRAVSLPSCKAAATRRAVRVSGCRFTLCLLCVSLIAKPGFLGTWDFRMLWLRQFVFRFHKQRASLLKGRLAEIA